MASLETRVTNIVFRNPVLPAAGPNVATGERMIAAIRGGAGGIVAKTVSVIPAKDPRPTIRKCGAGLLNCETWSEASAESFLDAYRAIKREGVPLIVSIGYSPDDVARLGKMLEREVAPDAIEFSTHYVGKSLDPLLEVARALRESVQIPIWMKVSPSTPNIEELAIRAASYVDAFVAINSVGPALDFDIETPHATLGSNNSFGWLSGPAIRPIALRIVSQIASVQPKPVIGVGGIASGADAIQFFMAGASLVQVCTAAILKGASVYGAIADDMKTWLEKHGYASAEDIRGLFLKNLNNAN